MPWGVWYCKYQFWIFPLVKLVAKVLLPFQSISQSYLTKSNHTSVIRVINQSPKTLKGVISWDGVWPQRRDLWFLTKLRPLFCYLNVSLWLVRLKWQTFCRILLDPNNSERIQLNVEYYLDSKMVAQKTCLTWWRQIYFLSFLDVLNTYKKFPGFYSNVMFWCVVRYVFVYFSVPPKSPPPPSILAFIFWMNWNKKAGMKNGLFWF